MAKDYYTTLGVSSGASDEAIKEAYRKVVKLHHPDVNNCAASNERIREINEAYAVLGDRERRRYYDDALRRERSGAARMRQNDSEYWSGGPAQRGAEPFRQEGVGGSTRRDFFRGGFAGGFGGAFFRRSWYREVEEELVLYLSSREAALGVTGVFAVRARIPCGQCGGEGYWYLGVPCPRCLGQGAVQETVSMDLHIPPGAAHGDTFIAHGGMKGDILFRCRIVIEKL